MRLPLNTLHIFELVFAALLVAAFGPVAGLWFVGAVIIVTLIASTL